MDRDAKLWLDHYLQIYFETSIIFIFCTYAISIFSILTQEKKKPSEDFL